MRKRDFTLKRKTTSKHTADELFKLFTQTDTVESTEKKVDELFDTNIESEGKNENE